MQQFKLVWCFSGAHELFPCVAGPRPDIFGMTEFLADTLCERHQHGSVEEWLAAKERNALHPWRFQVFDDLVFKFLRVFVACLEVPDGGVEAVDAVEGAPGDVKGVAHAFSVGDNEGFVVGNHPLGHALAIPLTGFRIVGKTVGGYGGATPGLAGRKVMALGFGLGRMQLRHDSLLAESISSPL